MRLGAIDVIGQLFLDLQRYNPYTKQMRQNLHSSLTRMLEKLECSLDIPEAAKYDKNEE